MRKHFRNADDKGFTLIELLIVIAIIGVLAAIAVPVFLAQGNSADMAAAEAEASALNTLVSANISVNGAVGAVNDATSYSAGSVGSMTITDGTLDVSGTDGTDYCVSVTVGSQTAAYGPGATANTQCTV